MKYGVVLGYCLVLTVYWIYMCLLMIVIVETKVTQNKSPVIVKRAVSFSALHSKIKRKNCQMLKAV